MQSPPHEALMRTLQRRFEQPPSRHRGIAWAEVQARLEGQSAALQALRHMEDSGGEPDVVGRDPATGPFCVCVCDCAADSPSGRCSLCYDGQALDARNEHQPQGSAVRTAAAMGIELRNEAQYHALQQLGEFDTRSSSWLRTPCELRALGGASFGDRRYGHAFIDHNGAQSYDAARAFRGCRAV